MKVLGREMSERFDHVYNSVLQTTKKSIEFKPLSQELGIQAQDTKGLRMPHPDKPDVILIYLDTNLSNGQFELATVHELCHQLVRCQGISTGWKFQPGVVPKHLIQEAGKVATGIMVCFSHISVNQCMINHGYDIYGHDNRSLKILKKGIRKRDKIDQYGVVKNALFYISCVYAHSYGCPTIDVDEMTKLSNVFDPRITTLAARLMQQLPLVDLTSATGYFQATKALRDALRDAPVELGINLSGLKFRNPQTGQPE